MSGQRRRVEAPVGDQVDERLEIALLRPAHVLHRQIGAVLLVVGRVATRAVRSREAELKLLVVHLAAVRLHRDLADDHDPPSRTEHPAREVDGVSGSRRGADDHRIQATFARPGHDDSLEPSLAAQECRCPRRSAEFHRILVGVDSDDPASGGGEDPKCELADQPQPDDAHVLTEASIGPVHRMQRDRSDGGIGGDIEVDVIGDTGDEVPRNGHQLGVVGPAGAAACDPVARGEAGDALTDLDDDSGG